MATPMTRVSRRFQLPTERQHDADTAMVGGGDDQATTITIDPSEREANPLVEQPEDENWDLPKGEQPAPAPERRTRETTQITEEEDEPEEDMRLAYDEEEEEENIRRGRRSRRNRAKRQAIDQRDITIQQLQGETQRLGQMLRNLYGGQFNLSARDLDQRISFHQAALERADLELARSVKDADGDTFAAINKERDKIYRELYQLQGHKNSLEARARETFGEGGEVEQPQQPQLSPEQQQAQQAANDEFERMRDIFLDRYDWFDPQSRRPDRDHREVMDIDREVAEDGYQRHTVGFWHEMERRMKEAGFKPSRRQREQEDDVEDEAPPRRQMNGGGHAESRRSLPPTGAVRSTRRPGGGGARQLSELQLDLLRDEDLLRDNLNKEELAKRDRIMTKWFAGEDQLRGRRR